MELAAYKSDRRYDGTQGDDMNQPDRDQPINLEESSFHELKRVVIRVDDDTSPSTRTPELAPHTHAKTDSRELLRQPFGADAGETGA